MKCIDYLQKHCQSCELLNLSYLESVKIKEDILKILFNSEILKIKESIICENGAEGTRNKAKLAVVLINEEVQFGFYNNQFEFKKLERCPLQCPEINNSLVDLKKLISDYKITPYDIKNKKGELKYLLITYSESTEQLLIRFVLRSKESIDRLKKLTKDLVSKNSKVRVVTANIQEIHQAKLEGDVEIVLTEENSISHQFGQYILFQGSQSFFQTNSKMALELYKQFQKELLDKNIGSLIDLYCGVGAFSFFSEKYCKKVVGVEISKEAIEYAILGRNKNNCQHISFYAHDVEEYLTKNKQDLYDAVVVNPPRRGLSVNIIKWIKKSGAKYFFYSSCNVQTLARDLKLFEESYEIKSIQMIDMFPFTEHFETLVVLSLKENKKNSFIG